MIEETTATGEPHTGGVEKASGFGGYGQKMLEKMGWAKGQGLGSNKDGIKEAIEVKKKEDTLGVGVDAGPSWDWTCKFWELAYDEAVKDIKHHEESSSSDDDSDSSDHDEPDPLLLKPSGKSHAVASTTAAEASSSGAVHHRDGTVATASEAELKIAAQLAKDPWGRWGGRGGKMSRIREQERAEAAKMRESLGLPPLLEKSKSDPPASDSSSSDKSDEDQGRLGNSAKELIRHDKAAKRSSEIKRKNATNGASLPKDVNKRIVVVLSIKNDPNRKKHEFKQTPPTGWWGAKYFTSVGAMSGMEDEVAETEKAEQAAGKRQAFDEGDQEALYMQAHDHQRVGRRGLGKSDKLKIAGGKWEGTKVTFEDGEAESESKKTKKKKRNILKAAAATAAVEIPRDHVEDCGVRKENKKKSRSSITAATAVDTKRSKMEKDRRGTWWKAAKKLLKKAPNSRLKPATLLKRLAKGGHVLEQWTVDALLGAIDLPKSRMILKGKHIVLLKTSKALKTS